MTDLLIPIMYGMFLITMIVITVMAMRNNQSNASERKPAKPAQPPAPVVHTHYHIHYGDQARPANPLPTPTRQPTVTIRRAAPPTAIVPVPVIRKGPDEYVQCKPQPQPQRRYVVSGETEPWED